MASRISALRGMAAGLLVMMAGGCAGVQGNYVPPGSVLYAGTFHAAKAPSLASAAKKHARHHHHHHRPVQVAARAPSPPAPAHAAAPKAPPPRPAKTYFVPVTAMPWIWKAGGENEAFKFGYPNGTPPVTVPLAALGAVPGNAITIEDAGGAITIGQGGPMADANGYPGIAGNKGALGAFPGAYVAGGPANLGALIGVFTDDAGAIKAPPFTVGVGRITKPVPPGATRLQLGINEDVFGGRTTRTRNSGGFVVRVLNTAHAPPPA